eukprot:jgi/Psemu1/20053/gm1.20053_g
MAMVTAVSFSASFEALSLITLAALRRATGREVGGFDVKDILTKMEALANASGDPKYLPAPSFGETIRLLTRLGEVSFSPESSEAFVIPNYPQLHSKLFGNRMVGVAVLGRWLT